MGKWFRNVGWILGPVAAVCAAQGCAVGSDSTSTSEPPEVIGPALVRNVPTDTRPPEQAAKPPPPISGGTLLITADGATAVAADPDRDRVLFVNLKLGKLEAEVSLEPGDEPGRLVQDRQGLVHAVLRGAGSVVSLNPTSRALVFRRDVCRAPRGIALDPLRDLLYVACAEGELVSLPAAGGGVTARRFVESDLRDVVVQNGELLVSRFRSSEVLRLSKDGVELGRVRPRPVFASLPSANPPGFATDLFSASAAYRTVATSDGQFLVLHQVATDSTLDVGIAKDATAPSPYGSTSFMPCASIVQTEITAFSNLGSTQANLSLDGSVLPVDIATSGASGWVAVASAGLQDPEAPVPTFEFAGTGGTSGVPVPIKGGVPTAASAGPVGGGFSDSAVRLISASTFASVTDADFGCSSGAPVSFPSAVQAVAVAFSPTAPNQLVVQSRQPAKLVIFDSIGEIVGGLDVSGTAQVREVELGGLSARDTGHELFHRNAGGGIACASCHPEGTEDGRVWKFSDVGERRTQALHNGLAGTQPFHWNGDLSGLNTLMDEVFVRRMGGVFQSAERLQALENWLFALKAAPALRAPTDAAALRGKSLFESPQAGCAECHAGAKLTDNSNRQVRPNDPALQTPTLIGVSQRAPFMHDGCAPTLLARFTDKSCGGGEMHGRTAAFSSTELGDLVAYLESL